MYTGKEVIDILYNDGITVTLHNQKIKLFGCITNKHRNLIKTHRDAVIAELTEQIDSLNDMTLEQHFEKLGWESEISSLLAWSWRAALPVAPFVLDDGTQITDSYKFYSELCRLECQGATGDPSVDGKLKAILVRLKEIVDSETA